MDDAPTPPDLPEATRIDYAPLEGRRRPWWRILVALCSTICLAAGSGSMVVAAFHHSSQDAMVFGAFGTAFLVAGIGLPVMICVARRL